MNQASPSEVQTRQRSLISSLGHTIGGPLVHLGGQLLHGSTSIGPNASSQPLFTSVVFDPWCTTFATSLILDSPIVPCTRCFYHDDTLTVHKLNRFGNTSKLHSKVNDHALLDVGKTIQFLHYASDWNLFRMGVLLWASGQ
ncbi:hypothetical protein TNCV_2866221 [Trichonephila clavipes]|nr:hypothetical protein TNCV_2866221 [Trichonephila clavipes]